MKFQYSHVALAAVMACSIQTKAATTIEQKLAPYKYYLENGTYAHQDWSRFSKKPLSRHYTFLKAFEHFERNNGKILVELGTTRSFTHANHPGCLSDDPHYWTPNEPRNWDWGAGSFTRIAAEALVHLQPEFHTVDLEPACISRCKVITAPFAQIMQYHVCSSLDFLGTWDASKKIDFIYMDTGDLNEQTVELHLQEAKLIVERNLLADNGIILIDDVRNQSRKQFAGMGKDKYSIPYFLTHGFKIVEDEFQVLLKKIH